ncbi:MAG: 3-deoxy-7-phosphoheptulonate synthase, partial [Clostridia bacterium]|nr:3-deoxy-7-phosphoheptulonate synthase [Clostridia bacterium]
MNMNFERKLPIPKDVKEMYPLTQEHAKIVAQRDEEIADIFTGKTNKLILVIGPCSADNEDSVIDYITRLR